MIVGLLKISIKKIKRKKRNRLWLHSRNGRSCCRSL